MKHYTEKFLPETMNIELTTNCPLHCPQCYCSLTGGKNIDLNIAVHRIQEGAEMGVKEVMLSGGETLCYPHIYELIQAAHTYCENVNIALSGCYFTQEVFEKLIDAGVTRIFISLNGSTEAINAQTRDGYALAIHALALLKKNQYTHTVINWVMHSSNADDFGNMIALAEKYQVSDLIVLGVKPDSAHQIKTFPTKEQMLNVCRQMKSYKGSVKLGAESCFSPMLALLYDTKLFGNLNVGKNKGCNAGRRNFSVNVDGQLSPCRHLEYYEDFSSLKEYWENSEILQKLRKIEENKQAPCKSCQYSSYCRHCVAINDKINHALYLGNAFCPLSSAEQETL